MHCASSARSGLRQAASAYSQAVLDLVEYRGLPGYAASGGWTRLCLDMQALGTFVCSVACARLLLWLIVWQLASYLLVWTFDLYGPAAAAPSLLALLWVLPWVAHARHREITRLLRQHGSV
jgi:hypothetical protein